MNGVGAPELGREGPPTTPLPATETKATHAAGDAGSRHALQPSTRRHRPSSRPGRRAQALPRPGDTSADREAPVARGAERRWASIAVPSSDQPSASAIVTAWCSSSAGPGAP